MDDMKLPGLINEPVGHLHVDGREAFLIAADHALAFARHANRTLKSESDPARALLVKGTLIGTLMACAVIAANLRVMARAVKGEG